MKSVSKNKNDKRNTLIELLRFGTLSVAIVFIGIGLMKNEQLEVLGKAVKICLECIGIG